MPVESPLQVARVEENAYGKSLVASEDVNAGVAVARFEGPLVLWADVPEQEIRHVLLIDDENWLIPHTDARFVNHACEPNCTVDDELNIVTLQPVAKGQEFTICYNRARRSEFIANPQAFFWDPRWSFECKCGSPRCQGFIDGYWLVDD